MKIKIHVTKEIIYKAKHCGFSGALIAKNCAIALAIRDIFPKAVVVTHSIFPFYDTGDTNIVIDIPTEATLFIIDFDKFNTIKRLKMQPLSFDIDVPDSVIERIGITEVDKILSKSKTLERV